MVSAHGIIPTQIVSASITDLWSDTEKLFASIRSRAYQLFEERGKEDGHDLEDWLKAEKQSMTPMDMEIQDTGDQMAVRVSVPGFKAEEIRLDFLPGLLTIHGEHHEKSSAKGQKGKTQCNYTFHSEVAIPVSVSPEKVAANLKNGMLEISVPRATDALQIQVKAA